MVLGVLPGLEERSSEQYAPVLALLDRVCDATSIERLYTTLWRALLLCPQARLAALNYLEERLPRGAHIPPAIMMPYLPQCDELVLNALGKLLCDQNSIVSAPPPPARAH